MHCMTSTDQACALTYFGIIAIDDYDYLELHVPNRIVVQTVQLLSIKSIIIEPFS